MIQISYRYRQIQIQIDRQINIDIDIDQIQIQITQIQTIQIQIDIDKLDIDRLAIDRQIEIQLSIQIQTDILTLMKLGIIQPKIFSISNTCIPYTSSSVEMWKAEHLGSHGINQLHTVVMFCRGQCDIMLNIQNYLTCKFFWLIKNLEKSQGKHYSFFNWHGSLCLLSDPRIIFTPKLSILFFFSSKQHSPTSSSAL